MPVRAAVLWSLATAAAALPAPAAALDRFEIQVYEAEINAPGRFGIEVHLNSTLRGLRDPEFPGQVPPHHVQRMTLEPAVGITEWLELGAYVQVMLAPGGDARFGGSKLRAKMIVPERVQRSLGLPVFLGLNVEVGRVPRAVEEQGWANEFRPIVGWKNDDWLLSLNPIVGYALSGPERFRADLEPCGKVAFNTQRGFAVGVEYYASLGFIDGFAPVRDQEHLLLAVLDLVEPAATAHRPAAARRWELNVGVGGALTEATAQHLLVKAIVGRSF